MPRGRPTSHRPGRVYSAVGKARQPVELASAAGFRIKQPRVARTGKWRRPWAGRFADHLPGIFLTSGPPQRYAPRAWANATTRCGPSPTITYHLFSLRQCKSHVSCSVCCCLRPGEAGRRTRLACSRGQRGRISRAAASVGGNPGDGPRSINGACRLASRAHNGGAADILRPGYVERMR